MFLVKESLRHPTRAYCYVNGSKQIDVQLQNTLINSDRGAVISNICRAVLVQFLDARLQRQRPHSQQSQACAQCTTHNISKTVMKQFSLCYHFGCEIKYTMIIVQNTNRVLREVCGLQGAEGWINGCKDGWSWRDWVGLWVEMDFYRRCENLACGCGGSLVAG